jgi:ketose-bisphosphate aldolase
MTIASMQELLAQALRGGYAIGYYESWDQYSLEGTMEAAEETASPAIIGFGGAVTNQTWLNRGGVEDMSRLARRLAERSQVPTAVLFNEAQSLSQIEVALGAGCNAVMLESSDLTFEENVALTRQVVAVAHAAGAAVEAELGHLADAIDPEPRGVFTDPAEAGRFVERTGVDALAVSIGNAHLVRAGEVAVDLALLERIYRATPTPLVIHGGTGFPRSAVRGAIAAGVAKFNVGTRLKRLYLAGIRDAMPDPLHVPDIHPFVGSRAADDVLLRGKERMKAEITELMWLYGSAKQVG